MALIAVPKASSSARNSVVFAGEIKLFVEESMALNLRFRRAGQPGVREILGQKFSGQ